MYNPRMNAYGKDSLRSELSAADPHRIIQMLMQGALDRLAKAKGQIERRDLAGKSETITRASAIIMSLSASLDMDVGGEVAQNLASLYDYMNNRLQDANVTLDTKAIDEVSFLLSEIKEAWDQIRPVALSNDAEPLRIGA
ncbi:MAG TPA: flagellar export chaperone FliS [Rheinheimera sp.]|nr:flagellar export chaperone FliS [Rheinheimera sp.]